jgi:tetratricopeptide (TPR) repeat protein
LEKTRDPQTRTESKTRLIEQVNLSLRSGDYARALDLLRGTEAEFLNDAEMSELKMRAEDGVKSKTEADRLITESQELFAQQKSTEAIQLLRKAYELDKNNSVARSILANALVEHANSIVETDWLEAEKLSNQALALNPAHPTAKTILNLIVQKKESSSAEDWVSQARKLHSSGDLFAALAWVAEGLAVHPHDPKLLQVQEAVQRDQETRRRQARRGDLEELRRLQQEIAGAKDVAAKQALVERIQTVAAKHWTDGEILSIANALLLRLGVLAQESSAASPRRKGATVIFHVPHPSAPEPPRAKTSEAPASRHVPVQPPPVPTPPEKIPTGTGASSVAPPSKVAPGKVPPIAESPAKVETALPAPQAVQAPAVTTPVAQPPAPAARVKSITSPVKQPTKSKSVTLILAATAVAIIVIGAILFFARKHHAPPIAATPAATATPSAPALASPAISSPDASAPALSTPEPSTPETTLPTPPASPDAGTGTVTPDNQPPADSARNVGTLLVVAGQDDARVSLNGKLQRQLTHAGELRIANLELKDYVVRVSKGGFQDPPQQKIRMRNGEEARLIFSLQPQPPRMASLTIQGGTPGTTVLVDQTPVGTIQPDGTLSVSNVNPGDHIVELRKERFKPRQLKKHFVAGGSISLATGDSALEAVPGELKITFAPADANIAIVKGDLLKMVSSGVPLNLDAGIYTLTARTADRFTRSATIEVIAGQSKTLSLSLAPNGMTKWVDPSAWKQEGDSFTRKGGDFVLYGVVPVSGTFTFSAMPTKGHLLQWVLNYNDPKNYVLLQMDDNNYYRSVIHNGEKTDEIIVPHKGEKKALRTLRIRVSPTEIVHQFKKGDSWTVLDRWTQPGTNLSLGKFGFYIPGNDQVSLSSLAHYADLNIH